MTFQRMNLHIGVEKTWFHEFAGGFEKEIDVQDMGFNKENM